MRPTIPSGGIDQVHILESCRCPGRRRRTIAEVFACHAATAEALRLARSGGGPTLIEAVTYRRNPHTTSDDDLRYRSGAENDHWASLDPIDRLRRYLESDAAGENRIDAAFLAALADEETHLSQRLRSGCRALPPPEADEPFRNTLVEMTAELRRQLDEHLAFVAGADRQAS